jgi:hypothetical protein
MILILLLTTWLTIGEVPRSPLLPAVKLAQRVNEERIVLVGLPEVLAENGRWQPCLAPYDKGDVEKAFSSATRLLRKVRKDTPDDGWVCRRIGLEEVSPNTWIWVVGFFDGRQELVIHVYLNGDPVEATTFKQEPKDGRLQYNRVGQSRHTIWTKPDEALIKRLGRWEPGAAPFDHGEVSKAVLGGEKQLQLMVDDSHNWRCRAVRLTEMDADLWMWEVHFDRDGVELTTLVYLDGTPADVIRPSPNDSAK